MQIKTILLITILSCLPLTISAEDIELKPNLESMNIETLIKQAEEASPEERAKIEDIIKKKIARANRENTSRS